MKLFVNMLPLYGVALLAEGVDRNTEAPQTLAELQKSPSSRRAWIEIIRIVSYGSAVLLSPSSRRAWIEIHRRIRGCGKGRGSPSSRRAWIEIFFADDELLNRASPSSRRAWIEIEYRPRCFDR